MLVSSFGSKVSSYEILSEGPWFYHQISSSYISFSMDRSASAAAASGPRSPAPRSLATVAAPPRTPPLLRPGARPRGPGGPPPPPPPRLSGPPPPEQESPHFRGMQNHPGTSCA